MSCENTRLQTNLIITTKWKEETEIRAVYPDMNMNTTKITRATMTLKRSSHERYLSLRCCSKIVSNRILSSLSDVEPNIVSVEMLANYAKLIKIGD